MLRQNWDAVVFPTTAAVVSCMGLIDNSGPCINPAATVITDNGDVCAGDLKILQHPYCIWLKTSWFASTEQSSPYPTGQRDAWVLIVIPPGTPTERRWGKRLQVPGLFNPGNALSIRGSILGMLDPSLLMPGYNPLHIIFLVVPEDLNPLGRQSLEAIANSSPTTRLGKSTASTQNRAARLASLQDDLLDEAATLNKGVKRPHDDDLTESTASTRPRPRQLARDIDNSARQDSNMSDKQLGKRPEGGLLVQEDSHSSTTNTTGNATNNHIYPYC